MSLYLVLPGMRMGTHYRWLRLVIQQALAAMERAPVPRGQLPVLVRARGIPRARAYALDRDRRRPDGRLRGEAVVGPSGPDPAQDALPEELGDVSRQCRRHPGLRQCGPDHDRASLEDARLDAGASSGRTSASRAGQWRGRHRAAASICAACALLDANEITRWFSRESGRQLILVPAARPSTCRGYRHVAV